MDGENLDSSFRNFCGEEKFLDLNLTWYTEVPEFSICFRKTALVWGPCSIFWLLFPFQLMTIYKSKIPSYKLSNLGKAKTFSALALIILSGIDIVYNVFKSDSVPVDILDPVVRIFTFIAILVLIQAERRAGQRISGTQFIFWFVYLAAQSFDLYSYVLQYQRDNLNHILSACTFLVSMVFALVSFICHFFSEPPPEYQGPGSQGNQCPELSASFPSLMTLSWIDGLCWTGYKRALTPEDLWTLSPPNNADYVVPLFQRFWQETVRKVELKNSLASQGQDEPPPIKSPLATFNNKSDIVSVDIKGSTKPKKIKQASTLPALLNSFGKNFLLGAFMKLIHDSLVFIAPLLLKQIIKFSGSQDPLWKGLLFTFLLLFTSSIQTIVLSRYFYHMYALGMWIKTALTSAIYRKSLTISSSGKKDTTTGEVVNLMAVDTQRIVEMIPYANMAWSAPFQIFVALYFLWQTLGPSVLAGFFVMVLLIPLNIIMAAKTRKLQAKQMKEKDHRVKMMNEILQGIKILKLYAWEPSFQDLISTIRQKEIKILRQMGYLSTVTSFVFSCAPFLVSLVTFATYVLSSPENILDSEKAFVALSLFNILNFPLSIAPMMIMSIVQGGVALKRIDRFMNREELKNDVETNSDQNSDDKDGSVIEINNATFQWGSDQESPTLSNINLKVKKGSLVAVVGTVGAGKSSLLAAMQGEMEKISGTIKLQGSVAYTAQQAWIQNCTVKENIVFHLPYDEDQYKKSIDACALKPDLEMLPGGDSTEIGEKGINLSGGQKQRVSIARAVYGRAEVYLLDDPLSAVDSHVGKHIFNRVIGHEGMLAGKTRILVTHSITHLPEVDNIIVMKEGRITETGTYKELLDQKGAFAEVLLQFLSEQMEENPDELPSELDVIQAELMKTIGKDQFQEKLAYVRSKSECKERQTSENCGSQSKNGSKLNLNGSMENVGARQKAILSRQVSQMPKEEVKEEVKATNKQYEAEKVETGKVNRTIYIYYIKNMGLSLFVASFVLFTIGQTFSAYSNIWLSKWADASKTLLSQSNNFTGEDFSTDFYLGVYGGLGFGQAFTIVIGALFLYLATLQGGKRLHENVLTNVLRLPMSYFDTTPQGRILNRFGKDVDVLDSSMPLTLRFFISGLLAVTSSFLVIAYTTPIFLAPISVIMTVYYLIQRIYVATSRQLKRLESVTRSPIYSHFGETVNGAATIRAYNLQETFIHHSEAIVDLNQRAYFPSIVANRWLSIRLETIGNLIVFCAALLAVLGRETLSPGLVGLSITYALAITQMLNWFIRMVSEVETNIVAAERLKEYTDSPKEAEWTVEATKPNQDWPKEGKIEFRSFSSRYREGLDLVLKQVSFDIEGGEKVGIVGRTGAGKSSLVLGLFRIVEAAEGSIHIDGIDISTLGLHQLRNKLTIIPQDPVLFSGSLRMNLDPFNKYSDDQVWSALKLSYLDTFVSGLPAGLEHVVAEGGENLSIGQRQLVCLTRALLRKTKVLILDEATAAIDMETDALIQNTIKNEFSDCTILTIAHRLNTILDYTKILVLSMGQKVEFDSPKNLLANKNSVFYSMCKDAGLV